MKATSPGRVVGKALTGLSGVEQGTVIVFIQNTYYDGVDDTEYAAYTQSNSGLLINNTDPLDRFTFMVQKSLSKLSPSFASGISFTASGLSLDSFGSVVNTLANSLTSLSGSMSTLSTDMASLRTEVENLKTQQSLVQSTPVVPQETVSTVTAPVLTDTEKNILAAFDS